MKLTILGNNSAIPAHGRYPTSQVVCIEDSIILIDCGEATQMLLQKYHISLHKIKHIFISHLHGDHFFGLPGLLTSMSLLGRKQDLHLYAPESLWAILEKILDLDFLQLNYTIHFKAIPEAASTLCIEKRYSLAHFPVEHGIFCHGLLVTEFSSGRKLLPEKCKDYAIPKAFYQQLKKGEDYIRKDQSIIKNEWLTLAAAPHKVYAYTADTRFTESYLEYIQNADLLYHESTYLEAEKEKAQSRFHSTALEAAQIAQKAAVKKLLLGHYSSRYKTIEGFEQEARSLFSETYATKEGDCFEL